MKYTLTIVVSLMIWMGCSEPPITTNAELAGTWKGVETLRSGKVQPYIPFSFSFNTDSTYTYKGGSYTEEGTFLINGTKLITTAEGDLEKQVEVAKIANDTLILNMNDAGTDMRMILVKQ